MNRYTDTANASPLALILCRNERLTRLLETELSYLGLDPRSAKSLPAPDGAFALLVADGDDFDVSACVQAAESFSCPLLVFGHDAEDLPVFALKSIRLRRPFLLTELEQSLRHLLADTPAAPPLAPRPAPPSPGPTPRPPCLTMEKGAFLVHGHPLPLTPAESALLECLYVHRGEAVSREQLGGLLEGGGNSVEVYICKLRAKIEKPLGRRMIHTVRGVGYRLEIGT